MANINSLMSTSSSSTSSLYGTRNVLSGLASGMDTESMIENSVAGYKTKITQLEQQQTKYQWKQDAYRSITDKAYDLSQKYTSYTSKTNLMSNAFFNTSIVTTPTGTNADKVSATGRASSDIQILAAEMAKAARYEVSVSSLGLTNAGTAGLASGVKGVVGSAAVADGTITVGALVGTMTLTYDNKTVEISFDESDTGIDANNLAAKINEKLSKVNITVNGETKKASDVMEASKDSNGVLTFTDKAGNGASPYISGLDTKLRTALGNPDKTLNDNKGYSVNVGSITANSTTGNFENILSGADYLKDKEISVTLDGVTKNVKIGDVSSANGSTFAQKVANSLNSAIENAFGKNKITVSAGSDNKLTFALTNETSTLAVDSSDSTVSRTLFGVETGGLSSYLNTGSSIESLLGSKFDFAGHGVEETESAVIDRLTQEKDKDGALTNYYTDSKTGNRYEKVTDANNADHYYRVDENNKSLYELTINDKSIYVTKESSLESVINSINASDMGVTASYSKLTGEIVFNAKETGAGSQIDFGANTSLASKLFSAGDQMQRTLGDVFGLAEGDAVQSVQLQGRIINAPTGTTFTANTTIQELFNAFNDKSVNGAFSSTLYYENGEFSAYRVATSNVGSIPTSWNFTLTKTDGSTINKNATEVFRNASADGMTRTEGQDAAIRAVVNGKTIALSRSSNSINMDGMTLNINESFGTARDTHGNLITTEADSTEKAGAVSFKSSSDADSVLKTIREFIDEYNTILKEVHDAYATSPAEKSSSTHAKYEPLTDDDKNGMSESAIASYEAKAKQGILFGDSDLNGFYNKLVKAFSPGGADGAALRAMGITTTYSGGLTQIKLDESTLRSALETDPDKVRDAFTKSKEYGASSDGLMNSVKKVMDAYASTSIASPGLLVKKASSTYSSTSLLSNTVQKQIDSVQTQIEKWQSKMSTKIDYYTRQFTALEKLMNQMNSQSSALAGLMGGY